MNIRRVGHLNKALLAKVGWRLMNSLSSWCSIVKTKYLMGDSLHHNHWTNELPQGSKFWNNVAHIHRILKMGTHWVLGNGNNIDLWEDQWLKDGPLMYTKFQPLRDFVPRNVVLWFITISPLTKNGKEFTIRTILG